MSTINKIEANATFKNIKIEDTFKRTSPNTNIITPYSVEQMDFSNEKKSSSSNKNVIYSIENDNYYQFGGNQKGLIEDESFLKDPLIKKIITKYFPDDNSTEEDLQLLFSRMDYVGCGYIALCNTIFDYAKNLSDEEFEKIFGFKKYIEKIDEDGEKYTDYNYEYMFLDFFLFYQKSKHNFKSIEEVYGNEKDNPNNQDGALSDDNSFKTIGADSTIEYEVAKIAKDYLSQKGIDVKTYGTKNKGMSGTWLDPNSDTYEKDKEYVKKYGFSVDDDKYKGYIPPSSNGFKNALKDNKKVIVGSYDFPLYYPKDINNNGKLDDVADGYENVGGHSITVVDVDTETNKLLVSSWGEQYVMDLKDVKDFVIYDYGK